MVASSRNLSECIVSDPQRLGGEPVFKGTRVPVHTLFDYLRKGLPLEQFLSDFEGVDREKVEVVLAMAEQEILQQARRP